MRLVPARAYSESGFIACAQMRAEPQASCDRQGGVSALKNLTKARLPLCSVKDKAAEAASSRRATGPIGAGRRVRPR